VPSFPSTPWAEEFGRRLNASPAYARAAQAWEGDILLLVSPADGPGVGVHLDLHHGSCRAARYVADASTVKAEFVYRGPAAAWQRLLRREIDPIKSILDGTFKLQGNMLKAMRFTAAAKEMLETAATIPLD
jgi:putative sterol carrier protein